MTTITLDEFDEAIRLSKDIDDAYKRRHDYVVNLLKKYNVEPDSEYYAISNAYERNGNLVVLTTWLFGIDEVILEI